MFTSPIRPLEVPAVVQLPVPEAMIQAVVRCFDDGIKVERDPAVLEFLKAARKLLLGDYNQTGFAARFGIR